MKKKNYSKKSSLSFFKRDKEILLQQQWDFAKRGIIPKFNNHAFSLKWGALAHQKKESHSNYEADVLSQLFADNLTSSVRHGVPEIQRC